MAEGPKHLFPSSGFWTMKLDLSDEVLEAAVEEAKTRTYGFVFKEVYDPDLDIHRAQSRFECSSAAPKEIARQIVHVTRRIDRNWKAGTISFRRSLPGGGDQDPHANYSLDDIGRSQQLYSSSLPASVIVSVMKETSLRVFNGCVNDLDESKEEFVDLQPGWCINFRGDLIHTGVGYLELNYRIHCDLALKDDKNWVPDQVTGIVQSTVPCDYCQKEFAPRRIGKHRSDCRRTRKQPRGKQSAKMKSSVRAIYSRT